VTQKKASTPSPHSNERFALPRFRPTLVFSRDDTSGGGAALAVSSRILIVEDDFLIASDMEEALSEAGLEVAGIASSAEEALHLAETGRPILAVMDIHLAGKRDGVDVALELFKIHGLRCVFATAHADERTRARAQPADPLAWVPKPYPMASLVEAVRTALKRLHDEDK
jgi:DNA-binding NarL/FixJ family response regulator